MRDEEETFIHPPDCFAVPANVPDPRAIVFEELMKHLNGLGQGRHRGKTAQGTMILSAIDEKCCRPFRVDDTDDRAEGRTRDKRGRLKGRR